jgi:hypothetical protein
LTRLSHAKIGAVTTKERLHKLVDELTDSEASRALELVKHEHEDPLLRAIANAPEDDEPWTEADEAAMAESRTELAAGESLIPLEQVMRELDDA